MLLEEKIIGHPYENGFTYFSLCPLPDGMCVRISRIGVQSGMKSFSGPHNNKADRNI